MAEGGGQRLDVGRIGHLVHKKPVDFGGEKRGGGGLLQNDAQHVFARKIAGAAQKRLRTRVVVAFPKPKVALPVVAPAGEGAGGFFHVILGIVAPPERE